MNIKIEVPFLLTFDDYHEIPAFADMLNKIQNMKIKSCEPFAASGDDGLDINGKYIGCFYTNTKPTKSEVTSLLKKFKIKLDLGEEDMDENTVQSFKDFKMLNEENKK